MFVAWLNHLYHVALNFTANEHPTPLDHREVHHIAKSVSRWVWRNFDASGFSARQAGGGRLGGRASGEARRSKNVERDTAIVEAVRSGQSQRAVALEYGLSRRAIQNILARGVAHEPLSDRSGDPG